MLMKNIKQIPYILILIVLISGCSHSPSEEKLSKEEINEIIKESDTDRKGVRGSCNQILAKSSCVDFVGSIFTEERMKLSCAEGGFSTDTCPYSELGGCQATPGSISESVVWSYSRGGQALSKEEAEYAKRACNETGAAKWITADEFNGIEDSE